MTSSVLSRINIVRPLYTSKKLQADCLSLSLSDGYKVIFYDDIFYVEGESNYTVFHTKMEKYISSKTLKYYQELLPKDRFIRIHRKYIVPVRKVDFISKSLMSLSIGKRELSISRSYKSIIKQVFNLNS